MYTHSPIELPVVSPPPLAVFLTYYTSSVLPTIGKTFAVFEDMSPLEARRSDCRTGPKPFKANELPESWYWPQLCPLLSCCPQIAPSEAVFRVVCMRRVRRSVGLGALAQSSLARNCGSCCRYGDAVYRIGKSEGARLLRKFQKKIAGQQLRDISVCRRRRRS